MRGVGRAATDTEDEKPAAPGAHTHELLDAFLAVVGVDLTDDLDGFLQVLDGIGRHRGEGSREKGAGKGKRNPRSDWTLLPEEGVEFGQPGGGADFVEALLDFKAGELVAGDQGLLHRGEVDLGIAR